MFAGLSVAELDSTNKISIVHTNLVAPIIIKNCQEEFQHVSDLKGPVVYGRLSQHSVTEHPLIQVCTGTRTGDTGACVHRRRVVKNVRTCETSRGHSREFLSGVGSKNATPFSPRLKQ